MRFRYLRDPLFLICVALYFLNRWVLKPHFSTTFFHSYLNDVICIPFWIPIMLFTMKALHMRKGDDFPTAFEILIPLILWSWVFEAYLPFTPMFKHLATSDYRDVLAYTIGGGVSALIWRFLSDKRLQRDNLQFKIVGTADCHLRPRGPKVLAHRKVRSKD